MSWPGKDPGRWAGQYSVPLEPDSWGRRPALTSRSRTAWSR